MIPCDIHTHSIASGHGCTHTISDMAKEASNQGITLLGISEHGPATMNSCKSSYFRSLHLAPKTRFQVELLYGVELNILDYDGTVDLEDDLLTTLDYAMISMHTQNLKPRSKEEHLVAYQRAMKHPKVKVICHCDDTKFPVDFEALLLAARKEGVVLEVNNASLAPWGYRGDTHMQNIQLLTLAKKHNLPLIFSSDSHGVSHLGDFSYLMPLVKQVEFPSHLIMNQDPAALKQFLLSK